MLCILLLLAPVKIFRRYVFGTFSRRIWIQTFASPFDFELFSPSLHLYYKGFNTTMAFADFSLFVVTTYSLVRPHGISHQSFLVYLPNLLAWFTVAFWTSRLLARLSTVQALVLGFCSSGYNFAIPSSRLHLTMQTLGITMRFAGNYALSGLSPQIDDMPVILKKEQFLLIALF